jgi:Ca2+-binding RTX toxin-like protein
VLRKFWKKIRLRVRSASPRGGKKFRHGRFVPSLETLGERVLPAVTATLAANGVLTVMGDALDNVITVSRDTAGTILVNSGAVTVQGGTPTPANTRLIQIFGLGGNDKLSLDETNGRLPGADIDGGLGNDTITGGSGIDVLTGGAGNDTYRFDTDNALGSDTIDESGGGIDTLDFSATTTRAVNIDLSNPAAQVVNAGLTLTLSAGNTIENVIGGALDDTLTGNALNNVIEGGGGNDTLTGGAGNDIYRFDTDNALGSDTIIDLSLAGGGIDTLDFSPTTTHAVSINLGIKAEQVVNANLTLTLSDAFSIENVTGGSLGDTITGNTLNNVINGGGGNDTIDGGAGNDTITGGSGDDLLIGGAGNDTYRFDTDSAQGSDTINESGGGIDTLDFSATTTRAVSIDLSNAAPQVVNAGLTLTLSAGGTIENVTGGALGDTLTGNSLNNVINGGAGNDTIDAGAGNDTITGGSGNDVLVGGAGNDTYRFDTDSAQGSDTINESGGGIDTLDFSATTTRAVNIDLSNAAAQVVNANLTLTLSAGDAIENVTGGALDDTLTGNSLNNVINGGAGNDTLTGGAGNDVLIGGAGLDVLNGGTGTNTIIQ